MYRVEEKKKKTSEEQEAQRRKKSKRLKEERVIDGAFRRRRRARRSDLVRKIGSPRASFEECISNGRKGRYRSTERLTMV